MENSRSRLLFDVLDKIGASEKFRQLYREKARYYEMKKDIGLLNARITYVLGGTSEGTTTPGLHADLDVVYCQDIPVVLNLKDTRNLQLAFLLTQSEDTPPGYVKLQYINHGLDLCQQNFEKLQYIKRDNQGVNYWTNVFNCYKQDTYLSQEIHGPATTIFHALAEPTDNVICLECKQWPLFAKEWLLRERRHGWPNKRIIDQCEKLGFFVVKIGHPFSKEKDLEWRVSFSLQERILMFNLTEVQHKTYVLLKLINHDLIQRKIGKSITSYHCKTSILYVIEQNPQSIWYPKNILSCAIKCLTVLLVWARKGHCPNYFIPEENMFDGKLTEEIRIKVIDVLEHILDEGESFLGRIETDNFGQYFMHKDDKDLHLIKDLEKKSYQVNLLTFFKISIANVETVLESVVELLYNRISREQGNQTEIGSKYVEELLRAIEDHRKLFHRLSNFEHITEHTTDEIRDFIDLIFPFLHTSLACHLFSYALHSEDISTRNTYLDLSENEFQKGMSSDVASGRLKHITCLYKLGKYELCKEKLLSLEQQFKPSIYPISPYRIRDDINNDLLVELKKHSFTTKYILQHFISVPVIFLPTELEIIPCALQFEMFRSTGTLSETLIQNEDYWYNLVVVDSEVYMYFLWYLLLRALNASLEDRLNPIVKLRQLLCKGPLHFETACNIHAWVCSLENFIPEAIANLVFSWKLLKLKDDEDPFYKDHWQLPNNAAKWHILLILKQVWFSQKSSNNVHYFVSFCFKCFECFHFELKSCSSCKIAKYCSVSCQKLDCKIHKQVCMQIRKNKHY